MTLQPAYTELLALSEDDLRAALARATSAQLRHWLKAADADADNLDWMSQGKELDGRLAFMAVAGVMNRKSCSKFEEWAIFARHASVPKSQAACLPAVAFLPREMEQSVET